jgi:hypothetical protein
LGVKLAQSRNEDSGIPATVGMMPPHELTAAHVPVVIHPHVPFPGHLRLTLRRRASAGNDCGLGISLA